MEPHASSSKGSNRVFGIPTGVLVILSVVGAALIAIFVFKVAAGTAITYGFIGLMVFSHLFMHGGHGAHGGHTDQPNSQISGGTQTDQDKTHTGHGGCH